MSRAAFAVFFVLLSLALPVRAEQGLTPSAGVVFRDGPLADVLAQARREKKHVFVEVYATWCGPCRRQREQVFDTPIGQKLTAKHLAWRVDFDAPEAADLMKRWAILNLPTVLVLRPDGSEVDRIEGYENRDAFISELGVLLSGVDGLVGLQKQLLTTRDPSEQLRLSVEIAHKQLVRSPPQSPGAVRALSDLERVITADVDGKAGAAEEALFLLGRYDARVLKQPAIAQHVWRELATRFPQGKYARTADWWYAGELHKQHTTENQFDQVAYAYLLRKFDAVADAETADAVVSFALDKLHDKPVAQAFIAATKRRFASAPPPWLPALEARTSAAP